MSLYISRVYRKLASGKKLVYFVLRANVWDYAEKRQRTKYVSYLGKEPKLSLKRAREIAKRIGIKPEDLKRVRGLKIIED